MLSEHPMHWTAAVHPTDVHADDVRLVLGGARAAGMRASALVVLDCDEVARRAEYNLGAVTSLPVLHSLLNLPGRVRVRIDELGGRCRRLLSTAPRGAVEWARDWVVRLLTPPLTVLAA